MKILILFITLPITIIFYVISTLVELILYLILHFLVLPFRVVFDHFNIFRIIYIIVILYNELMMAPFRVLIISFIYLTYFSEEYKTKNYFESLKQAFINSIKYTVEKYKDTVSEYLSDCSISSHVEPS